MKFWFTAEYNYNLSVMNDQITRFQLLKKGIHAILAVGIPIIGSKVLFESCFLFLFYFFSFRQILFRFGKSCLSYSMFFFLPFFYISVWFRKGEEERDADTVQKFSNYNALFWNLFFWSFKVRNVINEAVDEGESALFWQSFFARRKFGD